MKTKVKIISAPYIEDLEKEINHFLSENTQIEKVIGITFLELPKRIKACVHYSEAKPQTQPDILDEILVELLPVALSFLEGLYQKALIKTIKPEPPLPNLPNNNMN